MCNAKKTMRIIGLMTGTSMDGLDMCVCEFSGSDWQQISLLEFETMTMPEELKQRIINNISPEMSRIDDVCQLNIDLAEWFAQEVNSFLSQRDILAESIDLIGSHGQTFWHQPTPSSEQGLVLGGTLQLGDGPWLAQKTGITTVSNFRTADMAHSGQGAPLVPYLDLMLFQNLEKNRVLLNIGGMANLTYLPKQGPIIAFDTGPGNALIDGVCQQMTGQLFDADGSMALKGTIHQDLLSRWLRHPFFTEKPPRSTGREVFGQDYIDILISDIHLEQINASDALATVTALTAESILKAMAEFLPTAVDEVLISGGGLHNQALINQLSLGLSKTLVASLSDFGMDPDAKEAVAFAALALATIQGKTSNLPTVTGAKKAAILGEIAPGNNWRSLMQKLGGCL